jgi:hypothetical protein
MTGKKYLFAFEYFIILFVVIFIAFCFVDFLVMGLTSGHFLTLAIAIGMCISGVIGFFLGHLWFISLPSVLKAIRCENEKKKKV